MKIINITGMKWICSLVARSRMSSFQAHDQECGQEDFSKPNHVKSLELLNLLHNIVPNMDYDDFLDYLTNKNKEQE